MIHFIFQDLAKLVFFKKNPKTLGEKRPRIAKLYLFYVVTTYIPMKSLSYVLSYSLNKFSAKLRIELEEKLKKLQEKQRHRIINLYFIYLYM